MSSRKGKKDVRSLYRQELLSGFKGYGKPDNWNGDSKADDNKQDASAKLPQQKVYQLLVPVVIEQVSNDGDKYDYRVSFNVNADLLISPYSKRSKKTSQPTVSVAQTKAKKASTLPLVYGVHQDEGHTLSYPTGYNVPAGIASTTSDFLVIIHTAIERTLLDIEEEKATDDAGKREESSPTPKNLGTNKAKRRGKTLLPKVRVETPSKEGSDVDEASREILGN